MRSSPARQARPAARATARTASPRAGWRPAPPRRARTRGEPRAHLGRAGRVGQQAHRLAGDRLGREGVLDQLGHDAAARNQVHHAERVHLHERPAEAYSAATGGRRSPSAGRGSPSAPWRCPTRSPPRRPPPAHRRRGPRATRAQAAVEPLRRDRVEQRVVEAGRPRQQELHAAARAAATRRAASASVGRIARSSFGRLPGSSATVGASGASPAARRKASRGADAGVRSTSGWPTNSTGTPARGRSPLRTGRSPAPSTRAP